MSFTVTKPDVSEFFQGDHIYTIPRYQRNYVWDTKNWDQLINDILYVTKNSHIKAHFIGSIVFEEKNCENNGNIKNRSVIDGQQRITTIQLLLLAIIFYYKKQIILSVKKNENYYALYKNYQYLISFVSTKIPFKNDEIKLKNDYEEFAVLWDYCLESNQEKTIKNINSYIKEKKKDKSQILKAFAYFDDFFTNKLLGKIKIDYNISEFQNKLLSTRIISIGSEDNEEVYNIFEILNARGTQLKQIELLKNYIFKFIMPRTEIDQVKLNWAMLEEDLCEIDLDVFLFHTMKCLCDNTSLKQNNSYEVIKNEVSKGKIGIQELYEKIMICKNLYSIFIKTNFNDEIVEDSCLNYFHLKRNKQARPIIMALLNARGNNVISSKVYDEMIEKLRIFFILFNINKKTSNKIDSDIHKLSNKIFNGNSRFVVENAFYEFLNKYKILFNDLEQNKISFSNITYSNRVISGDFSSKLLVYLYKPFYINEQGKQDGLQINFDEFNIEHILNDSDDKIKKTSLGNLLIVPTSINEKVKNKSYSEKRIEFINSNIKYISNFANSHETFTEEDISNRTKEEANKLSNYYHISEIEVNKKLKESSIAIEIYDRLTKDEDKMILVERGLMKFIEYFRQNKRIETIYKKQILALYHELNTKYQYHAA